MAEGADLLHLFPELLAIGQRQLQDYCDGWLKRPIARKFGVVQLVVDKELLLHIYLADLTGAVRSAVSGQRPCSERPAASAVWRSVLGENSCLPNDLRSSAD